MADALCLPPAYFSGNVVDHARDLIGRELIVHSVESNMVLRGIIIETEAYAGLDDPASHAAFRPGGRAAAMFGPPGTLYMYAAYGMYPCLNIVTGAEGEPAAVLLRGLLSLDSTLRISGPGRLTRHLGVTLDDHGRRIGDRRIDVSVARHAATILAGPRVGITRAIDVPWRFAGTIGEDRDS